MNRRFIFLSLLICVLAACTPNQKEQCDQGVCVDIHALDTQNQDGSVTAFITVISDTDRNPVGIALSGAPGTIFDDPETDDAQIGEGGNLVSWQVNARANQPVILTCNAHFPGNDGAFPLRVMATYSTRIRVYNGVYIQLTDDTLVPDLNDSLLLNSAVDGEVTPTVRSAATRLSCDAPTAGST